ncbi:hypothetical protein [Hydrogenimonas sp. SS33]|uniref:hypothetical protein n=1 Tax=Hydrogenimonas leucolamina TaxID=2954236 RepID=UPI00336C2227
MFNRGLSLDQAPPFGAVLRFFLTIPLFGLLAAGALGLADAQTMTVWDAPTTAALVHLVLLGMVGMAMVGALFQMLPVIAGAAIKAPMFHARWIHALMGLGVLMLAGGLYFQVPGLFHPALALLLGSLGFVVLMMLFKLLKVENKTPSVIGMIVALTALGMGLLFAVAVTLTFMGVNLGIVPQDLRNVHMHFMLFGWIVVLIMAVAFQVIEMFYVTPPYPNNVRRWFPSAIMAILVADVPLELFRPAWAGWLDALLALLLAVFAGITLKRLRQRKRPVADVTVQLWRTGMAALSLAVLFWFLQNLGGWAPGFALAAYLFGYVVLSVVFAMSYKIIPFLVWFHLNAKGVLETPMMGDIIAARMMRPHLWLHWAVGIALAAAVLLPPLFKAAALLFFAESLLYGFNLLGAARIYFRLKDKGILK